MHTLLKHRINNPPEHRSSISDQIMEDRDIILNYTPLSAWTDIFSSPCNNLSLQIIEYAGSSLMWILKVDKPS